MQISKEEKQQEASKIREKKRQGNRRNYAKSSKELGN